MKTALVCMGLFLVGSLALTALLSAILGGLKKMPSPPQWTEDSL